MDEIDYRDKTILAPMVRTGTLAFRVLSRKYGADITYSEELIDKKIMCTTRYENDELGTVEYIHNKEKHVVWSTCSDDKPTVVQIGTATADGALKAAEHLYHDFTALDVNMGCPEKFSVKGKMGAALLVDRERIKDILSTLVRNFDKPITCKIRLLPNLHDTIDLVKSIESMGVKAIAVHARYIPQRPREPAHLDLLKYIVDSISIPVIANGDIFEYDDIQKTKDITGCSSVMIARGALVNCSIFQPDPVSQIQICREYIENCIKYKNLYSYTKYTVLRMFGEVKKMTKTIFYEELVKSKCHEDMLNVAKKYENEDINIMEPIL